jgi:ParB family transcriptional regulator, chromosome partitioning protein
MAAEQKTGTLADIPVDKIRPNPDNPRVAFRQRELEELQDSIRQYGVQVPIAVFKRGSEYILIDGERRWRCASKLNLRTIPALVRKEPGQLQNLLLMFNIHALREQWDLLTIARKLPKISSLLQKELRKQPTEIELSAKTGLSRGVIRRCRLLMELPVRYQDMLLEELKKPKTRQRLSEDFFIEMEKALKTASRAMPGVIENQDHARDVLLKKYKDGVIDNIVDFRKVAKIARATKVDADAEAAEVAIRRLVTDPSYSIADAWTETVSEAYAERDVVSRIEGLLGKLEEIDASQLDDDIREKLEELVERARSILEADQ